MYTVKWKTKLNYTVATVSKCNSNIVERGKIDTHNTYRRPAHS